MNLKQLRYVLEIERTGSITQAAKNLFMGQPNLSKSIRELEEELGIVLFSRTAKGVEPTGDGVRFLGRARNILLQFDELQDLYRPGTDTPLVVRLSSSRIPYLSAALCALLEAPDCALLLELHCRIGDAAQVISEVGGGESGLGVLRYPVTHEDYFLTLCKEARLLREPLIEQPLHVIVHREHPLARLEELPFPLPEYYTEISCGNYGIFPPVPKKPLRTGPFRSLTVEDTAELCSLLWQVKGAYALDAPLPQALLRRWHLVQRPCPAAGRVRDEAIFRGRETLSPPEALLLALLGGVVSPSCS